MRDDLVLAIDQGTSSTKCILVDSAGSVLSRSSVAVGITYPRPGWVEQDPKELAASAIEAANLCLDGWSPTRVAAVGLSTQRESVVLWHRDTGRPVSPVVGWQDRRTADFCESLRHDTRAVDVRRQSGLPVDPMFSAPKIRWLLDTYDPDRSLSGAGQLALGTVDSWLVYALTGEYTIEVGNAARTQLLDVATGDWSPKLLDLFGVPIELLPRVVASSTARGPILPVAGVLAGLPVLAVMGDSHAALFAHGERALNAVKVTYGTGSSAMRLVGSAHEVTDDVCITVAWDEGHGRRLAAEGNIRSTGATVVWLATVMQTTPEQLAALAATADNGGVYLVPAFGGLAAPWWDESAEGIFTGLTLGTTRANLARAAVESIAYQVDDVVRGMTAHSPAPALMADGGGSTNDALLQLQADIGGLRVRRARTSDLSALGVAYLAGNAVGLLSAGSRAPLGYDDFWPGRRTEQASLLRQRWAQALRRSRLDA